MKVRNCIRTELKRERERERECVSERKRVREREREGWRQRKRERGPMSTPVNSITALLKNFPGNAGLSLNAFNLNSWTRTFARQFEFCSAITLFYLAILKF